MEYNLTRNFTTITATAQQVVEIAPIDILKPYIRCLWVYKKRNARNIRIIPDCCADIIIDLNSKNARLVGLDNTCFMAQPDRDIFGIRFYGWALRRFTTVDLSLLLNSSVEPENVFKNFNKFLSFILESADISEMVDNAQNYLLELLNDRLDADVMNSLYLIVKSNANISVTELANSVALCRRALERKYIQNIGVSPKVLTGIIRYQMLLQDCVKRQFDVSDEVIKYGYFDQAHLYNDFRKYHGLGLSDAISDILK